jgi:hypothetical protein
MPTDQTLARLTKLHYRLTSSDEATKQKAMKKTNKLGYETVSLKRGITHFRSTDPNDLHSVISLKGTTIPNKKDIVSDLKLAFGMEGSDRQFQNRTKQIKQIYAKTPESKYLTGHSLGSSTLTYALATSPSILENTKRAAAFATGYTPFFHKSIAKDAKVVKAVNKKLTHYTATGDPISSSLKDAAVGRVKVVEPKLNDPHTISNFTDQGGDDE